MSASAPRASAKSTECVACLLRAPLARGARQAGSAIILKGFFAPKVAALVNRRKEGYFITPSIGKKLKVNGKEIAQRYDLKDGDIVEVGKLKLQFYLKD